MLWQSWIDSIAALDDQVLRLGGPSAPYHISPAESTVLLRPTCSTAHSAPTGQLHFSSSFSHTSFTLSPRFYAIWISMSMIVVSDDQLNAKTTPFLKYPPHPLFPNLHFLPIYGQERPGEGRWFASDVNPPPFALFFNSLFVSFLLLLLYIGVHHDVEPVLTIQLSAKFWI